MPQVIFLLILIGVAMWAVNTLIPMQQSYKTLINVLVGVCVAYWLFTIFFGGFSMPVHQYHWH